MICQVCGKNDSKYTCPACNIKTCSVDCIKRHKSETGCTGVKPRTTFVPLEKMDSSMLIKDCVLIDEVRSAVIDADANYNANFPKNKKKQWKKILEKECQERGITISFMPSKMDRATENKTRYRNNEQTIYWSCRFRFRNDDNNIVCNRLIHNQVENSKLEDIFNAVVETTPNDFVAKVNLFQYEILLLAEGAPGGGYYQIEATASLGENLFSKTIIEYPIFDVVPKNILEDLNIVTVLDVRNIEEQKEIPVNTTKKELPSYETIKEALKLDIITNVLKTSQLKEEQNAPLPPDYNPDIKNNDDTL